MVVMEGVRVTVFLFCNACNPQSIRLGVNISLCVMVREYGCENTNMGIGWQKLKFLKLKQKVERKNLGKQQHIYRAIANTLLENSFRVC
jgi:hypothetical protein